MHEGGWASFRGKTLGRYTVVEHLDSGGMAEIFLAVNEGASEGASPVRSGGAGFRKALVLKLLQSRYHDNAQVVEMFKDEARIGARLHHPSIVDIYDFATAEGQHFIAMEHIEGRILTQLIRRGLEVGQPLPLGLAAYICAQVAEGLAYMYEGRDRSGQPLSVVHRDISPTNIIISDRGHTKIIDFGIATDHGDRKEDHEGRPGKYSYMSPEQVQGQRLDGRSDIFSLGIILYEITLGRRLYRGKPQVIMKRIVEEQIRPPTFLDRDYPPALEKIVMKALAKRPQDRYASAEAMGRDLDAFLGSLPERIGERQVATYLRAIEAPSAAISDRGRRRAAAFVGEDDDYEDEELDFDRGSEGAWRVAADETARPAPSPPPPRPVPKAAPAASEAGGAVRSEPLAEPASMVPAAARPVVRVGAAAPRPEPVPAAGAQKAATSSRFPVVPTLLALALAAAGAAWMFAR